MLMGMSFANQKFSEDSLRAIQNNCTGRRHGDPISPEELVDADEFFENPDKFQ